MVFRRSTVFRCPPESSAHLTDQPRKRPPSAIWIYRKPVGQTSSEVVQSFREAYAGPWPLKVSHGGVLDPFAEGLVVVLVGAANRLFELLHHAPKRYVAQVAWGRETDTGDSGGRTVREGDASALSPQQLDAALTPFLGWKKQVPPNTSNKRVDGERAYEKAHRGETFELPAQDVFLHSARWLEHALPGHSVLELTVRGGFYVRSLATELGRALGAGAHLKALERTHLGPWTHAATPQQLTGRALLPWLPSLDLSDAEWGELRKREVFSSARTPASAEWNVPAGFPQPEGVRLFHQNKLVAVAGAKLTLLPGGC